MRWEEEIRAEGDITKREVEEKRRRRGVTHDADETDKDKILLNDVNLLNVLELLRVDLTIGDGQNAET